MTVFSARTPSSHRHLLSRGESCGSLESSGVSPLCVSVDTSSCTSRQWLFGLDTGRDSRSPHLFSQHFFRPHPHLCWALSLPLFSSYTTTNIYRDERYDHERYDDSDSREEVDGEVEER